MLGYVRWRDRPPRDIPVYFEQGISDQPRLLSEVSRFERDVQYVDGQGRSTR